MAMSSAWAAAFLPGLMVASIATQVPAASQVASTGSQNPHAALPAMAASRSKASVATQPSTTPASPVGSDKHGTSSPAAAKRMATAMVTASSVGRANRLAAGSLDSGNTQAAALPSAATAKA